MKLIALLGIPLFVFSELPTLLSQAERLSEVYSQEIAKTAPPTASPLADNCLQLASVWFSLDLEQLAVPQGETALDLLTKETVWGLLRDLGVEAVWVEHLRKGWDIDPKWGQGKWSQVTEHAQKRNITLIGDLIGNATAPGPDFQKGLQKIESYDSLYQMIEIAPQDWGILPPISVGEEATNVPWLTLQELYKRGYVPEKFNPYTKESAWNATIKIRGRDHQVRRWIYLKEGKNDPVLAWLSPSFAAYRLAAGDALQGAFELDQKILRLDGAIPPMAQEMLSLWVRKIGGFSAVTTNGTVESLQNGSADLAYDEALRPALLHALIAEDAEALRMIFRLFLEMGIETKRLIHPLQPFDQSVCDWVELMQHPKKKYRYFEDQMTGEILRRRLLKEDLVRLESAERIPPSTWVDFCARALNVKNFEQHREDITKAHLLLTFTYAMQPGAFSFSLADLLGALPGPTMHTLSLVEPSNQTLYASLPMQLRNPHSFASQLKQILAARKESNIATGKLIAVLPSVHPGTLLLLHRLPNRGLFYLLAVNFTKIETQEVIDHAGLHNTTAIDLMSHLAEEKVFSSSRFSFILPPMSGKAFYFQPKYL